jgi:ABC-2 type transport system permease protein
MDGASPRRYRALGALAWRAARRTTRQPAAWLPGVLVPLVIAAVFTADFGRAAGAIGFPAGASYLGYALPATVLVGAVYSGIVAGTQATTDVENGFVNRLLLAPGRRMAIVGGPLIVAALQAAVQSGVFLAIFAAFGVTVGGGVAGALAILAVAALFAVAVGATAIALGLLTGDSEVMQSLFGLLFILLFISSAFFPPGAMSGWFRAAAAHSPLTSLADGMRAQVFGGTDWRGTAAALGVSALLAAGGTLLARHALRTRGGTA